MAEQDRLLFDLSLNATPPLTRRIAIGEAGALSENMTLPQFAAFVTENIDTYTKGEINSLLNNYLAKNNLASYTPSQNYHPATKKYVDDEIAGVYLTKGVVSIPDISVDSNIPITFPSAISTNDYIVVGHLISKGTNWDDDNDVIWMVRGMTTTGFNLLLREVSPTTQVLDFKYKILKY